MNRTLLIFLMIGTALMIAVIGGKRSTSHLEHLPWQVDILKNGNTRVFGITLEKTSIQDANQILSSFPETRLYFTDETTARLVAVYDELNISGLMAQVQLVYDLSYQQLTELNQQATPVINQAYATLSEEKQMALLDTVVRQLIYIPVIDYQENEIEQRFGLPEQEIALDENTAIWAYPDLGLEIKLSRIAPDEFSYSPVKALEKTAE